MVHNAQAQNDLLSLLGLPSGGQPALAPKGESGFADLFAQLMGSVQPEGEAKGAAMLPGGDALPLEALQQSNRFNLEALLSGQSSAPANDLFASTVSPDGLSGKAQGMTHGEQLLHLLQVPPGQYSISKSEVVDGDLIVEATPRRGDMPAIKIAIPEELLRNGLDLSKLNLSGADLSKSNLLDGKQQSLAQLRSEFNALLKDVRATELEIRLAPAQTETAEESFTFRLTGHHPDGKVVFAGNLKQPTQGRTADTMLDFRTGLPVEGEPEPGPMKGEMQQSGNGMAGNGQSKLFEEMAALNQAKSPNAATKKFDFVQLQSQSGRTESLTGLAEMATTDVKSASEDDLLPRNVKFTLPEMLHSKLRPNGPSVTLRIHPANLGPARLSLIMRKDQLSARVVVDSIAAKQAVEGSMDKLIDQLQRADIKVESVQVMTSQQHLGNDSFGRQSQWAHQQQRAHQFGPKFGMGDATDDATEHMSPPPTASYVGAAGVNLLA